MEQVTDINKRIRSISEIRKITKAMGLISAVKMRDSRDREAMAHPFITLSAVTMAELAKRSPRLLAQQLKFPGAGKQERYTVDLYLLTGDKGLSGTYNVNILSLAERLVEIIRQKLSQQGYEDIFFRMKHCGKIGRDHMTRAGFFVDESFSFSIDTPTYYRSMDLADAILDDMQSGEASEVYMVYCRLDTAISIEALYTRLLPIDAEGMLWVTKTKHEREEENKQRKKMASDVAKATGIRSHHEEVETVDRQTDEDLMLPFVIEGDQEKVISYLIGTYLYAMVYGIFTKAYASEQLSRMTSMEGATKNADVLLQKYNRERNRFRQKQITTELTEIISGAEAIISEDEEDKYANN